MKIPFARLTLLAFAAAAPAEPAPSPLLQVKTLSLQGALEIAQEAVRQCHANGATKVGVCVVDHAGRVLVLLRDDDATEHTVLGAEQKAWTAANYKDSTKNLFERIQKGAGDDSQLVFNEKSLFLWGGVPIRDGADMVGAIGVCGNPSGVQDDAVAAGASQTLARLKKGAGH